MKTDGILPEVSDNCEYTYVEGTNPSLGEYLLFLLGQNICQDVSNPRGTLS